MTSPSKTEYTELTWRQSLAYMLLLLERFFAMFEKFARETTYNDSCYLMLREYAWAALASDAEPIMAIRLCERNPPDTEDFDHALTSQALNCALTIENIIEFLSDKSPDYVNSVSMLAQDSVALYVGMQN